MDLSPHTQSFSNLDRQPAELSIRFPSSMLNSLGIAGGRPLTKPWLSKKERGEKDITAPWGHGAWGGGPRFALLPAMVN